MTNDTQGAVGAETMTAGQPVIRKAVFEIASRRIKSGAPGLAPATAEAIARIIGLEAAKALASPRADSDERTAGEEKPHPFKLSGRPSDDMLMGVAGWLTQMRDGADNLGDQLKASAALYAVSALLTPAQPAGAVPDSLREAIQAYGEAEFSAGFGAGHGGKRSGTERAERIAGALAHLNDLIASHRAGQSAGSGADISVDVQTMRASNGTDYYVRIACDGREVTPHCFKERWEAEYEAAHYAWIFGLRADEPNILAFDPESHPNAPDSTRTGQGETGLAGSLRREIGEIRTMAADPENKAAYCDLTVVADNLEALLAARPAAPEAQGAWSFDMEAAEKVGKPVLVAVLSPNDGYPPNVGEAKFDPDSLGGSWWWAGESYHDYHGAAINPYAWRPMLDAPAPPASSGQGGR